jgi:hypothetical protein
VTIVVLAEMSGLAAPGARAGAAAGRWREEGRRRGGAGAAVTREFLIRPCDRRDPIVMTGGIMARTMKKVLLLVPVQSGAWPASASAQAIQMLGIFDSAAGRAIRSRRPTAGRPTATRSANARPKPLYDALTTGR